MITDPAQVALKEIEDAGLLTSDFESARIFMLEAMGPISASLPAVVQRALATAGAYSRGAATDEELATARNSCWNEMSEFKCDIPDPRGYAYRAALGVAGSAEDFQYPWYFYGFFLDFAVKAGVDSQLLASQLRKHYRLTT